MVERDLPYSYVPHKLSLGEHTLSYLDEGAGHPIVMLHGNPTWSYYYRNLISLLSPSFRLIVPDHIGCGLSDKPVNYSYTLSQHISNLSSLVEHLELDKFSLVVHDWGGAIGMGYAGANPEKIQSMVILNTAAFRSPRIPFRIKVCRTPILGALLIRGLNCFAKGALSMAVTKPLSPDVRQGYLYPYNSWKDRIALHKFVLDIPLSDQDASWDTLCSVERNLVNLTDKPTMILWGGRDFCFNDAFFNEWLTRFPEAQNHYFPDAGHYVLEDAYDQIEPLIANFFRDGVANG